MIELREARPPATAEAIASAEERLAQLGHRLPDSYRLFLLDHDGGEPVHDFFVFERDGRKHPNLISEFLGIGFPEGSDLLFTAAVADVPAGVLPIAGDQVGNLVCLDGRESRDGPVLFWDHEQGADPPDDGDLHLIAPNLKLFLDGLTEDPGPPPNASASPRKGWRKMFGGA